MKRHFSAMGRIAAVNIIVLFGLVLIASSCKKAGGPPWQVEHKGVVVRLQSQQQGRRPYLRADVTLLYPAELAKDKTVAPRIEGAEGRAAINAGLANLSSVEDIEEDQNYAKEEAAGYVREALQQAGLPTPTKVVFTDFVIQG